MNRITLLTVGSVKTSWAAEGCRQYVDRMNIDVLEISASKQKDPTKQMEEESQAILDRLEKLQGQVWVFDERGKGYTSPAFAKVLEELGNRGESVIFVLGGAYGLSDAVRERADKLVKLSDMVLPHELCRVVALEQLYRADQICKGSGYHH